MTTQAELRPTAGARYVLERDPAGGEVGEVVYRGFVHLPDADVPIEVRVRARGEEGGSVAPLAPGVARVDAEAIPAGGPRPAELERMAAALVKAAVRSAGSADRDPPRKIVRWRG